MPIIQIAPREGKTRANETAPVARGCVGKASEAGNLKSNRTTTCGRIKTFLVRITLLGLIPLRLGDWLVQRGGFRHD